MRALDNPLWWVAGLVLLCAVVIYADWHTRVACREKGGELVRASGESICAKLERLP